MSVFSGFSLGGLTFPGLLSEVPLQCLLFLLAESEGCVGQGAACNDDSDCCGELNCEYYIVQSVSKCSL